MLNDCPGTSFTKVARSDCKRQFGGLQASENVTQAAAFSILDGRRRDLSGLPLRVIFASRLECRRRTVYLPLLKVGAPRAPLAARPQLPDPTRAASRRKMSAISGLLRCDKILRRGRSCGRCAAIVGRPDDRALAERIDTNQGGVSGLFLSATREFPQQGHSHGRPIKPDELDLLDISDQTSGCAPADFWRISCSNKLQDYFLALIKRRRARDRTNREGEG